jgi:DeoR/GlpR family transcriptional regulator of sugar metabolism
MGQCSTKIYGPTGSVLNANEQPALTNDQISELREKRQQGVLIKDLMAHYGLSKATIYRYLRTKDA